MLVMVAHTSNPSPGEAERGRSMGLTDQPAYPKRHASGPLRDPVSVDIDEIDGLLRMSPDLVLPHTLLM